MGNFRKFFQQHKLISYILGLGFIVFINCFGFPFYNVNKEWPLTITALKICVVLGGAWETGIILAGLFSKKKLPFLVFALLSTSSSGLICRYILEFGEVSNSYNFTISNILLHLLVFAAVTFLGWLYTVKCIIKK